jgi:hypothetical protein
MDLTDLPLNEQIEHYFIKFKSVGAVKPFYSMPGYQRFWNDAAKLCKDLGAHPEDFVAGIFAGQDPVHVKPAWLTTKNGVFRYEEYMKTVKRTPWPERFKVNKRWLEDQVAQGFSEEETLLTSWIDFDPWFRICYTKTPYDSIKKRWLTEAKKQYDRELREFLVSKNLDYTRLL